MQKFLSDIPGASGGLPAGLPAGLQVAALNLKPDNNANKNEGNFFPVLLGNRLIFSIPKNHV